MPAFTMVRFAAGTSAGLIGFVVAFQGALAAGEPWGAAAYGGRFVESKGEDSGELPTNCRVSSAVAALELSGAAWLVLIAGSVAGRGQVPAGVRTTAS